MEIDKLSRRQFLGGAAAIVGAAVLPAITNVTPAMAMQGQTQTLPGTITNWILDPLAAARQAYEIYKGKWAFQSG